MVADIPKWIRVAPAYVQLPLLFGVVVLGGSYRFALFRNIPSNRSCPFLEDPVPQNKIHTWKFTSKRTNFFDESQSAELQALCCQDKRMEKLMKTAVPWELQAKLVGGVGLNTFG